MLPPHTISSVAPGTHPFWVDHAATGELRAGHPLFPDLDCLRVPRGEPHRLEHGRTFTALENPLIRVGICTSNKAAEGLVHGAVANDVRQFVDAQCNLFDSASVVPLEIVLYRFPLYIHRGREVVATEKEREHGRRGQFRSVGGPDHAWERSAVKLVNQRRTGFLKFCDIHPNGLKGPTGRTITTGETAPDILMRIDEHLHAIHVRSLDDRVDIVQVRLIVDSRSCMLNGLPGHLETQAGQAPFPQACKMLIRFLQRKWASDERDRAVLKEPVAQMGSTVGFEWYFRTATEIDPAQDQCPPVFVFEMGALDMNHYFTPP